MSHPSQTPEETEAPAVAATPEAVSRAVWTLAWIAVVIVHATLLALYYLPEPKAALGDEHLYLRGALSVASTGSSEVGLLWPPGYAWFLAPLVAVADGGLWLVQAVQIALLFAAAWFTRDLVRRAIGDEWIAMGCALLTACYPPLVAYSHYLWPEVPHLALLLAALWLLVRFGPRLQTVVGAGVLLGICLQMKVVLLPLLPLLFLALWRRWQPTRRLATLGLLLLVIIATVAPTLRAHQRDFGLPVLANSGVFNAWVGLNDVSRTEFRSDVIADEYRRYLRIARTAERRDEILRDRIQQLVEERGVVRVLRDQLGRQYFRLLDKDSFLTHQLAGGSIFERGDGYRSGASLPAQILRWLSYLLWAGVLAGAGVGLVVFPYRSRPVGWWIVASVLVQCGILLVLHVKTRYRLPMLPELFFFAVWAASLWRRRADGERAVPEVSRARWAGGLALAALLLYLAFGG